MPNTQNHIDPPKWVDKILKWFCKNDLQEEILGDLHELWLLEFQQQSKLKGTFAYLMQVILFLRPFAFKKRQNSNYIMYKSYFKYAWRNMVKHRGSTSLNVVSLSIGVASFIFIFVYLKTELSFDKFHKDYERIHRVAIDFVDETGRRLPDATTPPALAPALKKDFPEVESSVRLFPNWGSKFLFENPAGQKFNEDDVIRTDSTFFDVFEFRFLHGDASTALNSPDQIIITRSAAIKYFGKENVIGETIKWYRNEPTSMKVSAVMEDVPTTSHFKFKFLMKLSFDNLDQNWGWYNYYTYMKVKPNTNMASLEPKLQPFFEGYVDETEYYNQIYTQPLINIHLKSNLKWELEANGNINNIYIFAGLAIFILVISCLNYLNLTVAESMKRFKEVGVRKVFGAYKTSLFQQFIVETFLITLISLLLGSFFAEILFRNLGGLLGLDISILDTNNLIIFMLVSLGVIFMGLLAGFYPALYLSSFQVSNAIRGIINRSGHSILGLRRSLLVIQFAISAFMIFGTLVVYKQLSHMQSIEKGFDPEHVVIFENAEVVNNQKALKTALLKIPGVQSVGVSNGVIGKLNWTFSVGYPNSFTMNYSVQDTGYLESMGLKLIAGRNFSTSRATDTIGYNMIVNETALSELGFTLDDVGVSKPVLQGDDSLYYGTIVGVVEDFHFTDFRLAIKPFAFFYRDEPLDYLSIKIGSQDFSETLREVESTWATFSNGAPGEYFFLEQTFRELLAKEDQLAQILVYLSILAFFIAFIGMFAIANITIKDHRKEIAIRKVLGASSATVVNMVTKKFLLLVLIANVIAVPVAYFAADSWLNEFVYRVNPDILSFGVAIGSTVLVAALIVGYQSMKTAISNPVNSLRQE